MSDHSDERATMIAAGDLQEFAPRGREHCRRHPSALTLQLRRLQPASELCSSDGAAGLVGSLREVTIHERQRVRGGEGAGAAAWLSDFLNELAAPLTAERLPAVVVTPAGLVTFPLKKKKSWFSGKLAVEERRQ